jgi:L-threonylcarbamoyladenylate synthase
MPGKLICTLVCSKFLARTVDFRYFFIMQTKVIKIDSGRPDVEKIKEAARLLDSGELVAFPTETVYGIGCRAQAGSLARLDQVKQRSGEKHYTLHIGRKEDVRKYVPRISARAEKLIRKGWPGPISIVFELAEQEIEKVQGILDKEAFAYIYKDNSIGIRCPDNPAAAMLLQNTVWPIVAPSANIAGREPATQAQDVLDQLDGQIDLLLDGGPCKHKQGSTVVKIGKNGLKILRPGVVSKDELQRLSTVNILFVCTGNICRSPIAKGLCQKYLAKNLECKVDQLEEMGYKVDSAGAMAVPGLKASSESVAFCAERGVDISTHRSRPLTGDMLLDCDYIYVMCQTHRQHVVGLRPEAAQQSLLLAENQDIPDPIGGGEEAYKRSGILIEQAVKKRVAEFLL